MSIAAQGEGQEEGLTGFQHYMEFLQGRYPLWEQEARVQAVDVRPPQHYLSKLYLRVHPDLLQGAPEDRIRTNEESLARLNAIMDYFSQQHAKAQAKDTEGSPPESGTGVGTDPPGRQRLDFWLPPDGAQRITAEYRPPLVLSDSARDADAAGPRAGAGVLSRDPLRTSLAVERFLGRLLREAGVVGGEVMAAWKAQWEARKAQLAGGKAGRRAKEGTFGPAGSREAYHREHIMWLRTGATPDPHPAAGLVRAQLVRFSRALTREQRQVALLTLNKAILEGWAGLDVQHWRRPLVFGTRTEPPRYQQPPAAASNGKARSKGTALSLRTSPPQPATWILRWDFSRTDVDALAAAD